jgi:hypothetical protein
VDLHVHCNPDSAPPRRTDIFEIASLFKKHAMPPPVNMTIEQMKQAAAMGAQSAGKCTGSVA